MGGLCISFSSSSFEGKWPQFTLGKLWKKILTTPFGCIILSAWTFILGLWVWTEKEVMHPSCRIIWVRFLPVNPHLALYNSSCILVGYLLISFLRMPWSVSHCHESLLDCSVLVSIMPTLLIESVVSPGLLRTENSHHRAIQRVVQLSHPRSTCLCVDRVPGSASGVGPERMGAKQGAWRGFILVFLSLWAFAGRFWWLPMTAGYWGRQNSCWLN